MVGSLVAPALIVPTLPADGTLLSQFVGSSKAGETPPIQVVAACVEVESPNVKATREKQSENTFMIALLASLTTAYQQIRRVNDCNFPAKAGSKPTDLWIIAPRSTMF